LKLLGSLIYPSLSTVSILGQKNASFGSDESEKDTVVDAKTMEGRDGVSQLVDAPSLVASSCLPPSIPVRVVLVLERLRRG
jgi:hypothetical protein